LKHHFYQFYDESMSRQLLLEIIPAQGPTLAATVPGSNAAAVAAVAGLERGRALYLWGPPGSGRSHLLRATAGARPTLLLGAGTSASAMLALATNPTLEKVADVIAVDDIQDLDEPRQAAVFALYNRWRELASTSSAFALIVTGDRAPLSMSLREDLRTRLGWDLVFRLEPLSDNDKSEALAAYAKKQG
jgi:DnaA family protein